MSVTAPMVFREIPQNPVIVAGVRPGDILGVLAVLWRRMAVA
jgi:hypothetical protein